MEMEENRGLMKIRKVVCCAAELSPIGQKGKQEREMEVPTSGEKTSKKKYTASAASNLANVQTRFWRSTCALL